VRPQTEHNKNSNHEAKVLNTHVKSAAESMHYSTISVIFANTSFVKHPYERISVQALIIGEAVSAHVSGSVISETTERVTITFGASGLHYRECG